MSTLSIERHRQYFSSRKSENLFKELFDSHNELLARRELTRPAVIDGSEPGAPRRVRDNTLVYRQVLLHRSVLLFEGAVGSAVDENPYSMTLSVRGHFETTAALGFLHYRLDSLLAKNIKLADFDQGLCSQILGTRDALFLGAPDPENVLKMLEYADKSVSRHVFGANSKEYKMLKEPYEWLCEFCHPNFQSNSIAIDLDRAASIFRFRFGQPMRDIELGLLENLMMSAPLFTDLFDLIGEMVQKVVDGTTSSN